MMNLVHATGRSAIRTALYFADFFAFNRRLLVCSLRFRMLNPAIFAVIMRQIYFTGVQVLPVYITIAIISGIAMVGMLTDFLVSIGAYDRIGSTLTTLIVREAAPSITGILIALRSSSAVNAEIAVMNSTRELETLRALGINLDDYLFLPRVVAGMVVMMALSSLFVFVSVTGGYAVLSYRLDITFDVLLRELFANLALKDVGVFFFKVISMGYLLMAIPVFSAVRTGTTTTMIPISQVRGMMGVFYALIAIQIVSALI